MPSRHVGRGISQSRLKELDTFFFSTGDQPLIDVEEDAQPFVSRPPLAHRHVNTGPKPKRASGVTKVVSSEPRQLRLKG